MSDTETRLRKLVVEQLDVDTNQVTAEAKLRDDLGADSMDVVELIMEVEDEFEVTIGEDEEGAVGDGTFGALVELVEGKMARAAA